MIIQVAKVRPSGIRGVYEVREDGTVKSRTLPLCVKFPRDCIEAATAGTVWFVEGRTTKRSFVTNGFTVHEELISPDEVRFIRPSGELLIRWIAQNIEGVGDVKARRLIRSISNLNEAIQSRQIDVLTRVKGISEPIANALIDQWLPPALYDVLEWLQASGLPMNLADRLARVYGEATLCTLKTDPFILLAFGVSYDTILQVIDKLEIHVEEEHFLAAIAEHVTSTYGNTSQSTAIPADDLLEKAAYICEQLKLDHSRLIDSAIKHGTLVSIEDGYQTLGAAIQEETVARFLVKCMKREAGAGSLLASWEQQLSKERIEIELSHFEHTLDFQMTEEQRNAVIGTLLSPVTVISGGAGTGKTTILKAILAIYDRLSAGMAQFQVALSGRAAQRMSESTERGAITIAKLIFDHMGPNKRSMPDHLLLIVDEASMVDLLSAYKLVGCLPHATRIIFVGDAAQLPPVGAGLVFHAVMESNLPVFNLTEVKRQSDFSGIHRLAVGVREHGYDSTLLTSESGDVQYLATATYESIVDEYFKAGGADEAIVLTPTRRGDLGVDAINSLIQAQFDDEPPTELHYLDELHGWIPWVTRAGTKLRLGDQIMITRNDYTTNIRNGDLGRIIEVYSEPAEDIYGVLEINGRKIEITTEILNNLVLGYAITIHKSQGSQWPSCLLLLPSYAVGMIDQTLLYTAITRPVNNLIIMGDSGLVDRAIQKGSLALQRKTFLKERIAHTLEQFTE
ncbi:AAA family ATPase [Neptuniibacter sp. QD37_11]|uniref:AAA family ATPase n=1 Tax=Neptuniibacter sp. QD37_11 TaxID=3398209 RepID=UPI0039F58D0D